MHTVYISGVEQEAVGIAARDRGGLRFHAALQTFNKLDGQIFRSALEATRAARAVTIAIRAASFSPAAVFKLAPVSASSSPAYTARAASSS
jgi:hypothetical protein